MVRPSGTRGTGSTPSGQAETYDEPRARVSSWPPPRPARLRRERGSVGVASPTAPVEREEEQDATRDRHGHPPHLRGGGVLGGWAAAPSGPGGHDPLGTRGLRPDPGEGR